jgi:hypothetical protein
MTLNDGDEIQTAPDTNGNYFTIALKTKGGVRMLILLAQPKKNREEITIEELSTGITVVKGNVYSKGFTIGALAD